MDTRELKKAAADVRIGVIKALHNAGSGHPGGSLSATDIVTALYFDEMNIDPKDPGLKDEFTETLRKIGSKFQGHPNMKIPGIEMATGSLGQGFSAAAGMAMANKLDNDPGRIYAVLGDGELQEGLIWEAAMSSAHYGLDNLVAIVDHNGLQIDGRNDDVMKVSPVGAKFAGFGWNVIEIDGHDMDQIKDAFAKARQCKGKPTVIVAETVKGKGVSFMEDQAGWHGKAPNDEQTQQALEELEAAKAAL